MIDESIRTTAFDWLKEQQIRYGDELPRSILEQGFSFKGKRITLVGPRGIWKPAIMDLPLSITTVPNSPYDDGAFNTQFLRYKYRGTDPMHPDNVGLREAMRKQKPLIYFFGVSKE